MTRRLWPALLLPGLFFIYARALAAPANPSGPRLEMQEPDFDFGEVLHQEKYVHAFVVRNLGNADLVIKSVTPGCGCTAAKFDKLIPPLREGRIELVLDGAKVHGDFKKGAGVETNDPVSPHLTISIAGREIPFVDIQPEGTVYLHGRYGEPVMQNLTIRSNEKDLAFKVLDVTSNMDDKITYALDNGAAPGEYSLKLYKNPKLSTLSMYGLVLVHSNSARSPVTSIQVHVMTTGSISLSPTVLNYGDVPFSEGSRPQEPTVRTVTVTRAGGTFRIKDVSVSNPNYRAVVNPVTPGLLYRVDVAFTPPLRKGGKQTEAGEMVIHTDDPQEPTMRVQLLARSQ